MALRTKKLLIIGNTVVLRDGDVISPGFVIIEDGVIQQISPTKPNLTFDEVFEGHWVTPGFVDIHNHGIGGAADVSQYWLTEYTTKNLPKYGTTSCLATITFPASESDFTSQVVKHLQERCGKVFQGQTVIEGIHAEGPIIQSLGGMAQSNTDPSPSEFSALLHLLLPALKVMTISPSLESKNNYLRYIEILRENVVPALGHDILATEDDILGALRIAHEHKKRVHITHMFNVSKIHHRDVGLVNIGILSQFPNMEKYQNIAEPSVEMIGDLVHVHPLALKLALMSKDHKKIAFISDAIMEAGCEGVWS